MDLNTTICPSWLVVMLSGRKKRSYTHDPRSAYEGFSMRRPLVFWKLSLQVSASRACPGSAKKKNLAVEISLCVDVRFANQLPPTIDLRRITMCFGFHARFVSVGSKVGCTAIMCNCDVALSVLRNRFLSMRSIEFDWSIEVRLLIWSIKFRSSDLIDWAIANVWCVIVHQSHF